MIEIELKAFIDVLKASNLTKAKIAHGKARVWLDLDKLTIVYNGQETPLKRQSLNYGGYRYYFYIALTVERLERAYIGIMRPCHVVSV